MKMSEQIRQQTDNYSGQINTWLHASWGCSGVLFGTCIEATVVKHFPIHGDAILTTVIIGLNIAVLAVVSIKLRQWRKSLLEFRRQALEKFNERVDETESDPVRAERLKMLWEASWPRP